MSTDGRVGWLGLATVWFGGVISVSALLVGATLIKGLAFGGVLLWGGLGFLVVGACMALLGARAAEHDVGTGVLAARAFGTQGARLVLGIVVGVPLMGWFGVQTEIAAGSVVRIVTLSFGQQWPFAVVTLVLGATMTLTAVVGFGALKWLNYVAVPCKVALVVYGVGRVLLEHGIAPILAWRPEPANALDPLTAIGLAAGFVAVAAVIAPDYARHARTSRDAVLGCLLGLVPASIVLAGCGAVLAIAQNTHDIVEIYAGMGLPLLALAMLVVATWTTNVMNVYSAGLALAGLVGSEKRGLATAIAGLLGSVLAVLGILGKLIGFLSLLTATVLPIAGVMIAAWWLVPRPDDEQRGWSVTGLVAWATGVATVLCVNHPVRDLLGPVVAGLVFTLLSRRTVRSAVVEGCTGRRADSPSLSETQRGRAPRASPQLLSMDQTLKADCQRPV